MDQEYIKQQEVKTGYEFPLEFEFKVGTLANDFRIKDLNGATVAFVRQKMFRLKEDIQVFSSEDKTSQIYTIKADRIIDFNAVYTFSNNEGIVLGKIGRKGMRSIFKATYDIFDPENEKAYWIQEENPWAKFWDSLLGEIPILNIFMGYLFHPKYLVRDKANGEVMRLTKKPSFFGRRFEVDRLAELSETQEEKIVLGLMMLALLERTRG